MPEIVVFAEDSAHEEFIKAVLKRCSIDFKISVTPTFASVRGGHGKAIQELRQFMNEIKRGRKNIPDLIIVALDSNCKGYSEFQKEIDPCVCDYEHLIIKAIPDPHIERWLLLDSHAFKKVFGKGCNAPDNKCGRDLYKEKLSQSIAETGTETYLGGTEYIGEIVQKMDFNKMQNSSETIGSFLKDITKKFNEWGKPLVSRHR